MPVPGSSETLVIVACHPVAPGRRTELIGPAALKPSAVAAMWASKPPEIALVPRGQYAITDPVVPT